MKTMPFFFFSVVLLVSVHGIFAADTPGQHWDMANAYSRKGEYRNAMIQYDLAISLCKKAGKEVPYYLYTGAGYTALLKLHDRERAVGYFIAICGGPYSREQKDGVVGELANALYKLKRYREFLQYAETYVRTGLQPERKRTMHDLLANYFYSLGRVAEALRHARALGPDFWITKDLRPRTVTLQFRFRLRELMEKYYRHALGHKTILIEVPLDTYYQKLVSVRSTPAFTRIVKQERMNWLEFDVANGLPDMLEMTCVVDIEISNRSPLHVRTYAKNEGGIGYYAHERRERHMLAYDLDNPALTSAVRLITRYDKTVFEKIKTLNGWIDDNIIHPETHEKLLKAGKIKAADIPDIGKFRKLSDVYLNRAGDCVMRPGLFTGMCRILNVPARVILVFVYHGYQDKPQGYLDGAHGISEVYDPVEKDWIQTPLHAADKAWFNHHYSIVCEYYTKDDKPDNCLNLMFLTQYAIKMGDRQAATWSVRFRD